MMFRKFTVWAAMLLLFVALPPTGHHAARAESGGISVEGAWVRAIPPVVKNTAGYLEIFNKGAKTEQLLAVTTRIAKAVEIHNVFKKDGMMEMRPVKSVPIPAGGSTALNPGGYHLMIIGLRRIPKTGETVELTLKFRRAGTVKVIARVRHDAPTEHGHGMKPMKMKH